MITAALALLAQALPPAAPPPPPPQSTCDQPVYMIVQGLSLDRQRMAAYARALAESEVYNRLGGYYVNVPYPLEVFEGELEPNHANLVVRFPCVENARAFWNSRVYQEEIIPLRQNPSAGDYTVSIYAEAPLREDMVGKVGDNRFSYDFGDHDVPQVDMPVVGPDAEGDTP